MPSEKVFSKTRTCEQCGQALHRVRRRSFDKLLSFFILVSRYKCSNPNCGETLKFSRNYKYGYKKAARSAKKKLSSATFIMLLILVGYFFMKLLFLSTDLLTQQHQSQAPTRQSR